MILKIENRGLESNPTLLTESANDGARPPAAVDGDRLDLPAPLVLPRRRLALLAQVDPVSEQVRAQVVRVGGLHPGEVDGGGGHVAEAGRAGLEGDWKGLLLLTIFRFFSQREERI